MDKHKETFNTWNNIASVYRDRFMDLDLYSETYDYICNAITKENAKLLEIGCGPGNITRYLLSKRSDLDIFGIDISPNMIELAKLNNPTADFAVMDIRQINNLETKYDAIIGGFCLPYLSQTEIKKLISDSSDLLNDSGLLYLSFVEGDPEESGFQTGSGGRVFFYYHKSVKLKAQLIKARFEKIEIFRVRFKTSETEAEIHSILVAKKRGASGIV